MVNTELATFDGTFSSSLFFVHICYILLCNLPHQQEIEIEKSERIFFKLTSIKSSEVLASVVVGNKILSITRVKRPSPPDPFLHFEVCNTLIFYPDFFSENTLNR